MEGIDRVKCGETDCKCREFKPDDTLLKCSRIGCLHDAADHDRASLPSGRSHMHVFFIYYFLFFLFSCTFIPSSHLPTHASLLFNLQYVSILRHLYLLFTVLHYISIFYSLFSITKKKDFTKKKGYDNQTHSSAYQTRWSQAIL